MSESLILRCEDTLDGVFTAIYDAFVYKNQMETPYTDSISIEMGEGNNYNLFYREIVIETDEKKAGKTVETIQKRLGYSIYHTLLHALCHADEDRASAVLGYLVRGFKEGTQIREQLTDPYVMRVLELSRKVAKEEQKMNGFLRFRDMGTFLLSEIEPKSNLLPVIMWHFADRYPNENFVIYDKARKYAVVHQAYQECFFVKGEELQIDMLAKEDYFEQLWKQYFCCMGIKERKNERCQTNMLPKWFRGNMLEFQ